MESTPPEFELFAVAAGPADSGATVKPHGSAIDFPDVVRASAEGSDTSVTHIVAIASGTILHRGFAEEVLRAIRDPALAGIEWIALCSDGTDMRGRRFDAGNYLEDPATPVNRPLRLAGHVAPSVLVIDRHRLGRLTRESAPLDANDLVERAYRGGMGVYLSSRLRFSAYEPRPVPEGPSPTATDAELRSLRSDPSLSIVVRTTMKRPALLARNLRSLATQTVRPNEVFVVSTDPDVGAVRDLIDEAEVGSLPLDVVHATEGGPSRTAALRAGLEASGSDYTWFLDDDDWAATSAVASMVGAVHAYDRPIIVGAVESASEVWKGDTLAESTFIRRYEPGEWHRAFTGWNHLPNCAIVIPTDLARSRLSEVDLRSDLGEDYALQLALFTSPGATVTVVDETLAHVSVRVDADNAVTLEDREPWLRDLGSHISDLSNDPHTATDAFWRLGAAVRSIPYPAPIGQEPPSAADDVHHPKRSFRRRRG